VRECFPSSEDYSEPLGKEATPHRVGLAKRGLVGLIPSLLPDLVDKNGSLW